MLRKVIHVTMYEFHNTVSKAEVGRMKHTGAKSTHPSGVDDLDGPVSGECLWVCGQASCVPSVVSWVLSVQV